MSWVQNLNILSLLEWDGFFACHGGVVVSCCHIDVKHLEKYEAHPISIKLLWRCLLFLFYFCSVCVQWIFSKAYPLRACVHKAFFFWVPYFINCSQWGVTVCSRQPPRERQSAQRLFSQRSTFLCRHFNRFKLKISQLFRNVLVTLLSFFFSSLA